MGPGKCGVQVNIKKSAKGDIILFIKVGYEKAEKLKKEIQNRAEGLVVKPLQDEGITDYVSGMVEATVDEEMTEAITEKTGLRRELVSEAAVMVGKLLL